MQDVKLIQRRELLESPTKMPDKPREMFFTESAVIAVGAMMTTMLILSSK